jgi:hypothetical protein
MAKRKKASKVQKRAKLRSSAKRGKARKAAKAAKAPKRTVAKAKPKSTPVKKAARKVKQPVTPVVETVAVEVVEQPAPGVITVTEVEETRHTKPILFNCAFRSADISFLYTFLNLRCVETQYPSL